MAAVEKPIIGLAGGIGAGKSQVASLFAELGCAVIASDQLNHEVLRRPDVLEKLAAWWGPETIQDDGEPNRDRIAAVIFENAREKQRLEALVYPLIAELRQAKINEVNKDPAIKAIILDSPLLFESNLDRLCHAVVFVDTHEEQRLIRLRHTRGWDESQLRRRERWQMPLAEKRARSTYTVDNDGPVPQTRAQVRSILEEILSRRPCRDIDA